MCRIVLVLKTFFLSFFVIGSVDGLGVSWNNVTRIRRQADCGLDLPFSLPSFPCKSGECIDGNKECDGRTDCQDGSDETDDCKRIKCPEFMFTCNYGACIKKELECDGYTDCRDNSDEAKSHCKIEHPSQCNDGEFRCTSGQCINRNLICDGKADCDDTSDESKAACWDVECSGGRYKCNYGACVDSKAECNGIVECFDGSDEDPNLCRKPAPVPVAPTPSGSRTTCTLPQHPENGYWSVHGTSGSFSPGGSVDVGTTLKVDCRRDYILEGRNAIFCENGHWSADLGRCLKLCPPRISTETMKVTCLYKNKETENCTEAVEGTLAKFKCVPFYEDFSLKKRPVHLCHDGIWDQTHPQCEPVCGQKSVDATELIVGGKTVFKGDYPWQVALYTRSDKQLQCGGSLISRRLILTAAHCVTEPDKGKIQPKENYVVAVGKYFNKFDDTRDRDESQFSELEAIFVPNEYKAAVQNYLGDLAILVTVKTFVFSRRIQPVCLDAGLNFNLPLNEYGYVTGWGLTREGSKPSEVLKELKVPAVTTTQCEKNLPSDYDIFLTSDKMCAGYLKNESSACRGDSGGGLVFKYEGRYYITGIVSIAPTSPRVVDGCDSQTYTLYTKVSNYINYFILPKLSEYKI